MRLKNTEIAICISIVDLSLIDDLQITRMKPAASRNLLFSSKTKAWSDTMHQKIIYLSKAETRKKYNADEAVIFRLKNSYPYKNKYQLCTVASLHKANVADIYIFYFYTKSSKNKLSKCMNQTSEIIRFRN